MGTRCPDRYLLEVDPRQQRLGHVLLDAQQRPHVQLQVLNETGGAAFG